jgi:hypothetical protein
MIITDLVLLDIKRQIAIHKPELGGALFGPRDLFVVTHFEFDKEGQSSSVTYTPSLRLIGNIGKIELETGLKFKGIIHSHPEGFDRPSIGDKLAVQSFFRLNPHISVMALPIVQQLHSPILGSENNFIHWFNAVRSLNSGNSTRINNTLSSNLPNVDINKDELFVIPILKDICFLLNKLAENELSLKLDFKLQHMKIHNSNLIGLVAKNNNKKEFMFFVGFDYPITAPIVLYQDQLNTRQLAFYWRGIDDKEKSLHNLANSLVSGLKGIS